jgi:alpha/beta superfamily hydrolase
MPSRLETEVNLNGTPALVALQNSRVGVIVTHPWGLLGGDRDNNVVAAACLFFQHLGLTTVRFNFCGWQLSRGNAQVNQLQQVAKGLLTLEGGPKHILLVGYSYGSLITGSASGDMQECIGAVSIAPPFSVRHWLLMFNSNYHLEKEISRERLIPRLLVIGTQDNFTSETAFLDLVDRYPQESSTGAVIKGADHFFFQRERDLMDVIGQWLVSAFPQCQGDLYKLRELEFGLC